MPAQNFARAASKVVAVRELGDAYVEKRRMALSTLPPDKTAVIAKENLQGRELALKCRILADMLKVPETQEGPDMQRVLDVQRAFYEANAGTTLGFFTDPKGDVYVSGASDNVVRRYIEDRMTGEGASEASRNYIRRLNPLEALAFAECRDYSAEVGITLKPEVVSLMTAFRKRDVAAKAVVPVAPPQPVVFRAAPKPAAPVASSSFMASLAARTHKFLAKVLPAHHEEAPAQRGVHRRRHRHHHRHAHI